MLYFAFCAVFFSRYFFICNAAFDFGLFEFLHNIFSACSCHSVYNEFDELTRNMLFTLLFAKGCILPRSRSAAVFYCTPCMHVEAVYIGLYIILVAV